MAFTYSNNIITQTGTDTDLSGLSGLTGVTTTTIGQITTYSLANNILLNINGDCFIDPRINELETTRVRQAAIAIAGTLTLGEEIIYNYGSQYTSGRALNIIGGANVPWAAIITVTGTLNWYGCEVETASTFQIQSGGICKIRDGVFISRLGDHSIQQGNTIAFQTGSTCDIIGLKKTLTGSLVNDNSAIAILGTVTSLNASGIDSTGGMNADNKLTTLAAVPYSIVSNFKRLEDKIGSLRTSLNYFIDCSTWDTPSPVLIAYRTNFGTITRYGQAEFYRNCNGKIVVNGVGLQNAQLYWQDIDNGGRGTTTATEWLQEYITDREYYATTDVNGEFTKQVMEAAFYNTNPNAGLGVQPPADDRTETGNKITFSGYKYGYGTFSIEFQGNRTVAAEATTPVVIDGNITEQDKLIVDAYTEIDKSAKLYDRAASFLEDNLGSTYLDFILSKSGNLIDAGAYDVVIDAIAFDAFDLTGNVITIKATEFTGDMITTGIISLLNGATFDGVRTDANGTIFPDLNVSITNIVANSRIQIFNVTTNLEVVNEFVFGTSYTATYPEGVGYTSGDTIRVRLANADLSGYLGYETTVIASAIGFSALADQQADTVYDNIAIDGSNVTKFTSDYVGDDIELNVASNFTIGGFYAYWVFNLTTEQGIRNFFNSIIAINEANIMVDTDVLSLYFDSTVNTSVRQTDNRRLYRKDGLYPVRQPTTSGYGLDVTWQNEIFVVEIDVAVPSLTPAETANLAEITSVKTKTDQLQFTGTDLKATLDGEEVVTNLASRNASKADVSGLSTFDPTTDTVANVTLVATTTNLTNGGGGGSGGGLTAAQAAELTGIKAKTDIITFNGSDIKATLDGEAVVTDSASRNASKADVSALSTFDASTDAVANVTLVGTTTSNTDMRGTDGANTIAPTTAPTVAEIRAGFVANDFKATTTVSSNMRGTDGAITSVVGLSTFDSTTDDVITNTASRNASKADVSGLSTFNASTDAVANVTLVATTTTNSDMRGTDGANTVVPITPPTVVEIRSGFVANDFKATTTVSSNMRGTDSANTVVPDNTTVGTILTDLTAYSASALPKIRAILIDTDDLFVNQGDWITADVSGLSTFDNATDEVVTNTASRDASKADVSGLSTFDNSTDEVVTNLASRNASKADVSGLSTFDSATDVVANVTLVDTVTTNTDMRGTDGAITSISGVSTFNAATDSVITDVSSRNASKADVSTLSTFNPAIDAVANVTLVDTTTSNTDMRGTDSANTVVPDNTTVGAILTDLTTYTSSALPKIRAILIDTDDLFTNQNDWVTADVSGLSTFDNATDEVVTNTASRNASKADVSGLSTFNPSTDTVANVTLVDTTTTNTDMRGTDNVNTTIPPTVVEIRAGFNANDFKATETTSSNMRGTDGANTVVPTNETLTVAQNTKLMSLDTDNLDVAVSTRATKADAEQALADYDVDTKTNVKPSIPV